MAYTYDEILTAQFQRLATEQAQASADLEAARLQDDADAVMFSAGRVLEIDAQRNALA